MKVMRSSPSLLRSLSSHRLPWSSRPKRSKSWLSDGVSIRICPCAGARRLRPTGNRPTGGVAGRPAEVKTRERARWCGLVDIALCRVLSDTGPGVEFLRSQRACGAGQGRIRGVDGVMVESGRSRSVRYGSNGCAALAPQAGDRDGAEAARDGVRAGRGGFGNCVPGTRRTMRGFWR